MISFTHRSSAIDGSLVPLRRFVRDRSGNAAIIFALLCPVLVGASGIAIDMTNLRAQGVKLQKSLDAAALSAAKEYGKTQDKKELQRLAQAYFDVNLGHDTTMPSRFIYEGTEMENGHNVLVVSGERDVPMFFGPAIAKLLGGEQKSMRTLQRSSRIVIQNRSIEMALVLDNSGSMKDAPAGGGGTKIATLRKATKDLIDQMMATSSSNVQYPVSVSVVPFSGAVNVGPENKSASWMDTKGIAPSHHDEFDWSTWKSFGVAQAKSTTSGGATTWRHSVTGEYLTRFYLYDRMYDGLAKRYPNGWTGCVQSRSHGYAVSDDAPSETNPATLFVPVFAPSEHNWNGSLASLKNAWINDKTGSTNGKSDLEALTVQRDMNRYFDTSLRTDGNAGGPNTVCNTKPLTPLTKTKSKVQAAVAAMEPLGGTNIAEGLAWGWRTLSSTPPFTEGRKAHAEDNLKIIVLMTDGENTYNAAYTTGQQVDMPNGGRSMYGTYGYAQFVENGALRPGRMFDSTTKSRKRADIDDVTDAMNENMTTVCENAKSDGRNPDGSDGIVIFSIAFDLKDGSPVKERLKACASNGVTGKGAKLYYDARSSADLTRAFGDIVEEISSLRIAR